MDLRTWRVIKGKKQWSVTKKTGISQTKISLIENGYVTPSDTEKQKLAAALGLSADQIDWNAIEKEDACAG